MNDSFSQSEILVKLSISELNKMQESSLAAAEDHPELVILSPTGSGKTLAFLLMLLRRYERNTIHPYALVIVPTRELALQTGKVFSQMATGLKCTLCYGGHKRKIEENNLREAPSLIIGTPGRIGDHIRRKNFKTPSIKFLVLDEYDKSLEMGFTEEMKFILDTLPNIQTRILTSATASDHLPEFLHLKHPVVLNFLENTDKDNLELYQVPSGDTDKQQILYKLLCTLGNRKTIIFLNQRDAVNQLSNYLREQGITNVSYHGAMEQREREMNLAKFRNGSVNFLVTTDLASRGLDIPHIRYIIHYQLPETKEVCIHRNGRTARMGASGSAIFLLGAEEYLPDYIPIEKVNKMKMEPEAPPPDKPQWATLFFAAGKKNKLNKGDIVGFLINKARLRQEDIGLIEVKDFYAFAAIRRSKMNYTISLVSNEKIKNKKVRIAPAK